MSPTLLQIDGHTVAAEVHVKPDGRPPVLFLHGIMTSPAIGRELFADPAAESWLAVGLPGHHPDGAAARRSPGAIDAELFGHLVETAVGRIVGERPVIAAGWSLGGFAALNLAIRHPRRVAAVASLAGFARGELCGAIAWLQWLARSAVGRRILAGGLAAAAGSRRLHGMMLGLCAADRRAARAIPGDLRSRMHDDFSRHDPASLAAVVAALESLDISGRLTEIRVPAWIAGGERDPIVPLAETLRLARGIPGAELRLYPAAGHLFCSEWPAVREDFAAWRRRVTEPYAAP